MQYTIIQTGGAEYKLAPPSVKILQQFLDWSKSVLPNPYADLVGLLDKLPKEYADQLFAEAKKKASLRGTINDPDTRKLAETIEGGTQIFLLRLKPFHPTLTTEDVQDIMQKAAEHYGDKWEHVLKEASEISNAKVTEEQAERFFSKPKD